MLERAEHYVLSEEIHDANISYMNYMCKNIDNAIDNNPVDRIIARDEWVAEKLIEKGYRKEQDVATEIFNKIKSKIGFDGHSISVWKCDLVEIAKDYNIEL